MVYLIHAWLECIQVLYNALVSKHSTSFTKKYRKKKKTNLSIHLFFIRHIEARLHRFQAQILSYHPQIYKTHRYDLRKLISLFVKQIAG